MKILRIIKSNEMNYDAYISFVIGENEYYGVINDLLSKMPTVQSEVFKDIDLIQTKEWVIRTKGLITKTVKKWLKPEKGTYVLLNDKLICYDTKTGKMTELQKDDEIQVINSNDAQILINYNDDQYILVNDNFVYFNWWFVPKSS
jgi:hypothetical protein